MAKTTALTIEDRKLSEAIIFTRNKSTDFIEFYKLLDNSNYV